VFFSTFLDSICMHGFPCWSLCPFVAVVVSVWVVACFMVTCSKAVVIRLRGTF